MSRKTLRAAAVLLLLFAAGHTLGFLRFVPPSDDGRAVLEAMRAVSFDAGGRQRTYADFYVGFGITITCYLVTLAIIAWYLSTWEVRFALLASRLCWIQAGLQVANAILCGIFFSPIPLVLSVLLVALFASSALRSRNDPMRTS